MYSSAVSWSKNAVLDPLVKPGGEASPALVLVMFSRFRRIGTAKVAAFTEFVKGWLTFFWGPEGQRVRRKLLTNSVLAGLFCNICF